MIKNALHAFDVHNYDKSTVIGEFSGRDSVAAILKAYESDDVNFILPIATFAGTEYGNYDVIYENYLHLKERVNVLFGDSKVLYPLIEYNREDIWAIMNGRTAGALTSKNQFYSPCIGCHLYFHLTKLPFAKELSGIIISGERESHDGRIKVNQLGQTLDVYTSVLKSLGFELRMPLRHMDDGDAVESLIGWAWKEGLSHPECVLSGNYRDRDGRAVYDETGLISLLNDYVKPAGLIVGKFLLNDDKDMETLKNEVLSLI